MSAYMSQALLNVFTPEDLQKGKMDIYSLPTKLRLARLASAQKPVRVLKSIEDLMESRKAEVRERLESYRVQPLQEGTTK